MNSRKTKTGPKPVEISALWTWEREWYGVFYGLAFGLEESADLREYFEPEPPPKPTGDWAYDKAMLRRWERLRSGPDAWKRKFDVSVKRAMPAEPDTWQKLKTARSARGVVAAYERSRFWLNPRRNGRPYVNDLRLRPDQFLRSKRYRYPASDRPSSEVKRVLHFARAMAGVAENIGAIRAIDVIRLYPHGDACYCAQCESLRQKKLAANLAKLLSLPPT